ncbi:MAG: prepilin-type N-terminal cleavage/methylation domain-containing protein [Firmicutes bacterium]|nr:prepilin-type N-terminal cleavage/methylation domain-containing protein [Bacillota bacterium]
MKNINDKNGFTLVELLAVIVVLAIIISIAVPASISISNRAKEKMYKTKVEMIENAGKLYAQDNPSSVTNDTCEIRVKNLIEDGYLKADEDKKVLNPKDKSSMNDECINLYKKNGRFYAEFNGNTVTKNSDSTINGSSTPTNGSSSVPSTGNNSSANSKSNDATLSNILLIGEYSLSPTFNSSVTHYSVTVPYSATSLGTISTVPNDRNASVAITGNSSFSVGTNNRVTIRVTAEDGTTTKTYTIDVTRSSASYGS